MSKNLADVRAAVMSWMADTADLNVGEDVVPSHGAVGFFTCNYHENIGKSITGITLASCVIKVYVSRAHEPSALERADAAQSTLQESLESFRGGPWTQMQVVSSDVAEETLGEATYVVIRFFTQFWV